MSCLIRKLECLNCSNDRSFVFHTLAGEHRITQLEAAALAGCTGISCGRCGGTSVIAGWGDSFPYRAPETILPRRRRSHGDAATTAGLASGSPPAGGLTTATP